MTFELFKQACIDRQKSLEINQFLHLYLKAETFADLLQLAKQANFSWSYKNGVMDQDFWLEIPETDREAANFYNSTVTLSDINSDTIYVLESGNLNLNQTGTNRCKVVLLGGQMVGNCSDQSMIEVESFLASTYELNPTANSYCYVTNNDESSCRINARGSSIVKLASYNNSETSVVLDESAYLNADLHDNSSLESSISTNKIVKIYEKATATEV